MTTPQENAPVKKFSLPNIILVICLGALLCGEAYFGYHLYASAAKQKQIKEDYNMSNNITFGLFSVDQWRDRISDVVNSQVHDFHLTRAQRKAMQAQVEQQLHGLINKTVADFNKPQKSLGGKLKKFAFNTMVNADDLHAQVPSFSKTIIDKVSSPASQKRLKGIASSKINQLEKATYDSTSVANYGVTQYLYKKYRVADPAAFNNAISSNLKSTRKNTDQYALGMLACVMVALGLWALMRKQVYLQSTLFVMALLFAFILLMVGTTAPIIEVDARIKSLNFMLMGEKVAFENQVLFFQSQSILNVVQLLVKQSKFDAVVVGVLIFVFVIILPLIRMIARGIYVLSNKKFADNKVVRYLTFESGKWDMADVMVVGILMTYIGLNGILKSQLSNLNINNSFMTTTTVNDTSLQPGYFIFVGYVIFAVILSTILKRINPHDALK